MLNSLRANRKGIIMMIASSLLACTGQLLWKISNNGGIVFIVFGFFFYGVGAILMLKAYSFGKLSVLQPMMSMSYVFTLILGYLILGEVLSLQKILAVIIIMIGVFFIGSSNDE